MLLQILLEPEILKVNRILLNIRDEQHCNNPREDTQRARHEERILALLDDVIACCGDDVGEDIGSDEGADFADGSGDGVVLAADGGGASFGGDEADVVAGTEFAEGEEYAIDDDKAALEKMIR
jgi:hypothetical protein